MTSDVSRPRRLRRRLVVSAAAVVVCGAAATLGLTLTSGASPRSSGRLWTTSGASGGLEASPLRAAGGPPGWKPADYAGARLWVPPDWLVIAPGEGSCSATGVVLLGSGQLEACQKAPGAVVKMWGMSLPTPAGRRQPSTD